MFIVLPELRVQAVIFAHIRKRYLGKGVAEKKYSWDWYYS